MLALSSLLRPISPRYLPVERERWQRCSSQNDKVPLEEKEANSTEPNFYPDRDKRGCPGSSCRRKLERKQNEKLLYKK